MTDQSRKIIFQQSDLLPTVNNGNVEVQLNQGLVLKGKKVFKILLLDGEVDFGHRTKRNYVKVIAASAGQMVSSST